MSKPVEILLVEDDQIDQMNIMRAFKKNNMSNPLHIANDGIEALEMLRGGGEKQIIPTPQVILLDINMPRMNGIEFLKEVRKDPKLKRSNVFVLSTSNDDQDKFDANDLNVAGYILKPLEFDKFVEAVSQLKAYWQLCERPAA